MLVLSRKTGESVVISVDGQEPIEIVVVQISGDKVRLGCNAARSVTIHRGEIQDVINMEGKERK